MSNMCVRWCETTCQVRICMALYFARQPLTNPLSLVIPPVILLAVALVLIGTVAKSFITFLLLAAFG